MRITFFDRTKETYESRSNVIAMSTEYFKNSGRIQKYFYITKYDGTTEKLECNRYTIKRLREEE